MNEARLDSEGRLLIEHIYADKNAVIKTTLCGHIVPARARLPEQSAVPMCLVCRDVMTNLRNTKRIR